MLIAYLYRDINGTITALHCTLLNNATFRTACGFDDKVPSWPTPSRVFIRMAEHNDGVERIMDDIVREAKGIRPDLGEQLAVDATPVRS